MKQEMNALQVIDRYRKEVIRVSTWKHDIKVHCLHNTIFANKWMDVKLTGRTESEKKNILPQWQKHKNRFRWVCENNDKIMQKKFFFLDFTWLTVWNKCFCFALCFTLTLLHLHVYFKSLRLLPLSNFSVFLSVFL